MSRWIWAALLVLGACGGEGVSAPSDPPAPEPSTRDRRAPAAPLERSAPWLRELLAYDLRMVPTDRRTIALAERLGAPVTCPRPGTGCYVELPLAGQTTQVHVADDQAIQVWGPTEPLEMPRWVEGVEEDIDRSSLTALDAPGTRPDRLWRGRGRLVLLHDHSVQPCAGFCPAMIWIALPDHPSAAGYGFRDEGD